MAFLENMDLKNVICVMLQALVVPFLLLVMVRSHAGC